MENNKSFLEKADLEVSDLMTNGGYLPEDQAMTFIQDMIKESVLMKMMTVKGIKSHTKLIDKISLGSVLKPGTSGVALSQGDRSKPTTEQVTLNTYLMKAEIRLNDETVEDNIEQGTLKNTVMKMFKENIALDLEDCVVNGDSTGSTGGIKDLFNGLIKSADSGHTVNAAQNPIDKSYLKSAAKAMPSQYNRMRQQQGWFTSENAELDYQDKLADRATVLGDNMVQNYAPARYGNRTIYPVPVFPDNLGAGTNETVVILMDPKNGYVGLWRNIRIETDRDITTGEWIAVATLRAGFVLQETDAVVKLYGVTTS